MNIKKITVLLFVLSALTNCEKKDDESIPANSLIGTTWSGTETFKCTKEEGCREYQILKITSQNELTFQYIDGEFGTYDVNLIGTYSYSHPQLTINLPEATITAIVNDNNICLDPANDCPETSPELLIRQ